MRTFLTLAFSLLLPVFSFAAPIPGTVVLSKITLGDDAITNKSIGDTVEMKGTPKQVADLTSRNAVPPARRTEGMECWVISEAKSYRLVGGILNTDWVEVATGTNGGFSEQYTAWVSKSGSDATGVVGQRGSQYLTVSNAVFAVKAALGSLNTNGAVFILGRGMRDLYVETWVNLQRTNLPGISLFQEGDVWISGSVNNYLTNHGAVVVPGHNSRIVLSGISNDVSFFEKQAAVGYDTTRNAVVGTTIIVPTNVYINVRVGRGNTDVGYFYDNGGAGNGAPDIWIDNPDWQSKWDAVLLNTVSFESKLRITNPNIRVEQPDNYNFPGGGSGNGRARAVYVGEGYLTVEGGNISVRGGLNTTNETTALTHFGSTAGYTNIHTALSATSSGSGAATIEFYSESPSYLGKLTPSIATTNEAFAGSLPVATSYRTARATRDLGGFTNITARALTNGGFLTNFTIVNNATGSVNNLTWSYSSGLEIHRFGATVVTNDPNGRLDWWDVNDNEFLLSMVPDGVDAGPLVYIKNPTGNGSGLTNITARALANGGFLTNFTIINNSTGSVNNLTWNYSTGKEIRRFGTIVNTNDPNGSLDYWDVNDNEMLFSLVPDGVGSGPYVYLNNPIADGAGFTNLPIRALQGSGGAGTAAATNGTSGQALLSSGNGGVYWGTASGGDTFWTTNTGSGASGGGIEMTNLVGLWIKLNTALTSKSHVAPASFRLYENESLGMSIEYGQILYGVDLRIDVANRNLVGAWSADSLSISGGFTVDTFTVTGVASVGTLRSTAVGNTNALPWWGPDGVLTNASSSTIPLSIVNTNFAVGIVYSNVYGVPILVHANANLTAATAAGIAQLAFEVIGTKTNYASLPLTIAAALTGTATNAVTPIAVPANGTWLFRDTSTAGSATASGGQIVYMSRVAILPTGFSGDGSGMTNINYRFLTNVGNIGVIPAGKTTYSNITANITIAGFYGIDLNYKNWAELYVTNGSGPGTPRSVTLPAAVGPSTNTFFLDRVVWVTNDVNISFGFAAWRTNAAAVRWSP